ncbi:hypothetical protein FQN57_002132 [Myotisia sp. PD_48]|nr:hypothetical protein FQN57_002132 [Myotisia sp. PD_48]
MARLVTLALALSISAQMVLSAKCGPSNKCPEDTPCCSLYGDCGVGAYCLGGCDPKSSFTIGSCVPAPVCKSATYNWDNLDNVAPNTKYLGDADKYDWVSSGEAVTSGGKLLLTMAPDTVGTLMGHNHYMWYGKTSARLKTSRGAGVVTAFILMSDVKDEIDYEFVGADLDTVQTNYYFQGITDYTKGVNLTAPGNPNTFDTYHTYEIDWKPDVTTWSIDGKVLRTLKRDSTFNKTSNQYHYPQSPSRVQLSLWPAGLPTNGKGTVDWAGGLVDWNHQDVKTHGYYYSIVDEVKVECYDPPANAKIEGDVSYIYTSVKGTEDTVKITDKETVLKSFLGNGEDMEKDYPSASGSSKPSQTSDIAVIPGMKGGGAGTDGRRPEENNNNGNGGSGDGGSGSPTEDGDAPKTTGFNQNDGSESSASTQGDKVLKGSLFAVMVAVMALVTM